jgi:SulP family sulfate permease
LLVLVAVAAITVAVDLMIAVVVGLVITAFLFIKEQINKTIIRRIYTANLIHSKKIRHHDAMKILEEKGEAIKVYELSGSIFFGTCDKLFAEMEKDFDRFCIILDFKRVHTIDLTGAQLLKQIIDRVKEKGNLVLLSYLDPGSPAEKSGSGKSSFDEVHLERSRKTRDETKALHGERSRTMNGSDSGLFGQTSSNKDKQRLRRFMADAGVIKAVGEDFIFADTDHAQEWAEDALIQKELAAQVEKAKLDLSNLSIFAEFEPEQLEIIRQHLHPLHCNKSDIVFKEGDPGDKMYFILSGGVSVLASVSENGRARRLTTFGEGVFFGDMAILEGKPRSATVRADSDTELLYMSVDDFQHLVKNEPLIASKMLMGMAKELSYRLRLTSIEVRTLEE